MWDTLEEMLKKGDLKGFWETYAKHLEGLSAVSRPRMLLYVAALKTSEALC